MNTARVYKDSNGVERTLCQMVKCEPEWAAKRIQAGEEAINSLQQLKAEITIFMNTVATNQGEHLQQNVDNFIERMQQLSAG